MTPGGARILIVEDEPSLADSVRYSLEREGFRATVAADRVRLSRSRNRAAPRGPRGSG